MKESQSGKKYSLAYKYEIRLCKTHIFTDFLGNDAKQFYFVDNRKTHCDDDLNEYGIVISHKINQSVL